MRLIISLIALFLATPAQAALTGSGNNQVAVFAGGCFWCMESEFSRVAGVMSVTSGFAGGTVKNPTYAQVSSGKTGHAEAIKIEYNGTKVSYEKLLEIYWSNVDPTDAGGQFNDRGNQYRTAIFYNNTNQQELALASKKAMEKKIGKTFATEILPADAFYPAAEEHQKYAEKNPFRYNAYKMGSGRSNRLKEVWGSQGAR